jgi:ribosomal protein S14
MNKNIKNILFEKIVLINLSKGEIFKKILKSVQQNNNIQARIKLYSNFLIIKKLKKNYILSRSHKICILTGKRSGILKGFSFSRYTLKKLILQNKMTNFKKNNW